MPRAGGAFTRVKPWGRRPDATGGLNFLGHHKCASIWLRDYLLAVSQLNTLTIGRTHLSRHVPDGQIRFLANASYDTVAAAGLRGCHIVRNPLAMLNSAYFSHRDTHPTDGWPQLDQQRAMLRATDPATGVYLTLAFPERTDFHPGAIGPFKALRAWDFDATRFLTLRMEDMVADPSGRLGQAFAFLGRGDLVLPEDADFSFRAVSGGRRAGEIDERSHYRSGDPEDWRRHLPQGFQMYVRGHFRPLLERFYPAYL